MKCMIFTGFFLAISLIISCSSQTVSIEQEKPIFSTAEDRGRLTLTHIEKFRLIDQFSDAHALTDYTDKKSIFLIAVNKACIKGRENDFLNSIPSKKSSVTLLVTSTRKEKYDDYEKIYVPTLFDRLQFVSKSYGLKKIGSFVEIHPKDGQIIKKGQIKFKSDSKKDCINSFETGEHLNFSNDVSKIFSKTCMRCHMKFAQIDYFTSMASIQKWSKMIAKTMEVYRMPPGGTDAYLYPLHNPLYNFEQFDNLDKLYLWIASGANYTAQDEITLQSNRKQISELSKARVNSQKRKPDYIFTMNAVHKIPASGIAYYDNAELAGPIPEDMFIEAVSFSHNLNVLHHSNIHVSEKSTDEMTLYYNGQKHTQIQDTKQRAKPLDIDVSINGENIKGLRVDENDIFTIARSDGLHKLPEGTAAFVPKGSYLTLQNHYHPNGTVEINKSKIEFFTYQGNKPPKIIRSYFILPNKFKIKAHQKNYLLQSYIPIDKDITLLRFQPHMHYRGRSVKLYMTLPDQKKTLLLSVPFYQLKFENTYIFTKPIFLPSGSVLLLEAKYDNSAQNISNPDPNQDIEFGESTYLNEMHSMRIKYVDGKL